MADEDKKKPEKKEPEKKADKESAPAQTEVKTSVSLFSKKNIIILSVMLLVLGGGTFFGLKKISHKEEVPEESEKAENKEETALVFPFETIVVNIAGTQGTRYLKATIAVEYDSIKTEPELKARNLEIMDILNSILSSKTLDQIISVEAREEIKRDIRDQINAILSKGQIKNIFFSEYIVQ